MRPCLARLGIRARGGDARCGPAPGIRVTLRLLARLSAIARGYGGTCSHSIATFARIGSAASPRIVAFVRACGADAPRTVALVRRSGAGFRRIIALARIGGAGFRRICALALFRHVGIRLIAASAGGHGRRWSGGRGLSPRRFLGDRLRRGAGCNGGCGPGGGPARAPGYCEGDRDTGDSGGSRQRCYPSRAPLSRGQRELARARAQRRRRWRARWSGVRGMRFGEGGAAGAPIDTLVVGSRC